MATAAPDFTFTPAAVKAVTAAAGAGRSEMWSVSPTKIKIIPGFNVRDAEDPSLKKHVRMLVDSMLTHGWKKEKPVTGYAGKDGKKDVIWLTDGHCRLQAVQEANVEGAGIENITVILKPPGTDEEALLVDMVTSNSGKSLTPMETARVAKRLQDKGVEPKDIAKRIGITPKYFADLMLLLSAPASIRKLVSHGKLSATEAVAQIKAKGAEAEEAITEAAKTAEAAGKAKVTRKAIDGEKAPRKPREKKATDDGATTTSTLAFDFRAGQRLGMEKIAAVKDLAGADWWRLNEEAGRVDILADVHLDITITRKPTPVVAPEDEEL